MSRRDRFPLPLVVIAALVGCTAIAAADDPASPSDSPACLIDVTSRNGLLLIEGEVTSDTSLFGTYALSVQRGGAVINQSGLVSVAPGETLRLGTVRMNGPISGLEATLTLTVDGEEIACDSPL